MCAAEHHDLTELEPTFRRPDVISHLPPPLRGMAKESEDLCMMIANDRRVRHFVRGIAPVPITDREPGARTAWGLWIEVPEATFHVFVAGYADEAKLPLGQTFEGTVANRVPCYDVDTTGLKVTFKVVEADARPVIELAPAAHPFAEECRAGVTSARQLEWLHAFLAIMGVAPPGLRVQESQA
jgi:hypothetical protein